MIRWQTLLAVVIAFVLGGCAGARRSQHEPHCYELWAGSTINGWCLAYCCEHEHAHGVEYDIKIQCWENGEQ